jgi:hypothetical protein
VIRSLRVLATLVAIAAVEPLHAQSFPTDRGVWQVGGSASAHRTALSGPNIVPTHITSITVAPRVSYFMLPGLTLGATVPLRYTSSDAGHATGYGFGPEVTYYFGHGKRSFYPFVGLSALWEQAHGILAISLDSTGQSTSDNHSRSYMARGGVAAMLARNVAVTGELYYADDHSEQTNFGNTYQLTHSEYGVQFGIALFLY